MQTFETFQNIRIEGIYQLSLMLGRGSFGCVYMGLNLLTNQLCAVKLELTGTKYPQLRHEAKVLEILSGGTGIATLYWKGNYESRCLVMVIQLLGPTLEDLLNICNRRFSMKTCIMLADQMITRFEYIHSKSYINRDVKPTNFVIGLRRKSHILYIIDFGLAKKYRDPKSLQHIPYKENKNLTGTAKFASINAHLGMEQSRRDDLEGAGYVILFMMQGHLPWERIKANNKQEKYHKIMSKKMEIPIEVLTRKLPEEIPIFLNYIRGLIFDEKPDYKYLRKILRKLFFRKEYQWDYQYDWTIFPDDKHVRYTTKFIKIKILNPNASNKNIQSPLLPPLTSKENSPQIKSLKLIQIKEDQIKEDQILDTQ